ncbi:MAG: hypothetical protein ACE5I1_25240 [bacterium]
MNPMQLSQIEQSIIALPQEEQLKLVERIVYRLRSRLPGETIFKNPDYETELEKMAADLQIQSELKAINEEFAETENDGLEKL